MKLLKTFSFNQAAALLLVSLSTGCAVLRVDVDVYKGPLANHEDVQIKQFTAMAMGAKPLLISLRNNLMWRNGCDVKPPPVANEDLENVIIICRAQAVIEGWYNDDTGLIGELPLRVSPSARKVNTVLSLYDDLEDPLLQEFNAVLTGAEQKIVEATQIIKPDFEQDQRLWEKISLGFRLASEFKKELDLEQEPDSNQLNEAIRHYHNAVKKVIAPCENPTCLEDRSAKRLESSYQKLSKVLSSSQLETRDTNRSSTVPAELRLLNESDRRLKYSKVLFRDTASEQAKMFDQKLESIGQAAVAVGEGFHKIWDASIAQIVEVDTLTKFRPTRDRYVPILAKLIAQYTQPQHLAAALKIENRENEWLKKFAPGDKFWDPSGPNISDWPQTAERAIQLAFATEPVKMAQLFQELDEKFVRASEADMEKIGKVRYQYLKKSSARKFGLVRLRLSLFDSESDANEHLGARELLGLVKLREQLGTLKQLRAEGLDKGRPTKGLERIIEEYLKASERTNDPADVALENSKRNLTDALIQFSEKILVLANNDELLRVGQASNSNGRKHSLDEYVLVLQAIGNSIQVQADDLTHRRAHDLKLKKREPAELQALNQAQNQSPSEFFDAVHTDLRAKSAYAERAHKDRGQAKADLTGKQGQLNKDLTTAKETEGIDKAALSKQEGDRDEFLKKLRMRFDAYRSLGETPDGPKPAPPWQELKEGVDSLHSDIKTLQDVALATPASPIDGDAMLNRIKSALAAVNVVQTPFQGNECENSWLVQLARAIRINCAKKYFDNLPQSVQDAIKGVSQDKPEAVLKKVVRAVGENYLAEYEATNAIQDEVQVATSKHDKSSNAVAQLEGQSKVLMKQVDDVDSALTAANIVRKVQTAALDTFEKFSGEALSYANKGNQTTDARIAWDRLLSQIKDQIIAKSGSPGPELTKLQQAHEELSGRNSPSRNAMSIPNPDGKDNQLDVLDSLIARLRYEHVLAVKNFGEDSKATQDISAALKFAYDQRSGMAYIRPASAYLRSSYAATGLQDDPRLRWENMLQKHAGRNLKIFPGCNTGNYETDYCADERRIDTLSSIDKQFWQNVNSIRVAGAGNTNYAIVKDDIGNWYVKGYSADPKPILRSAQSLALFGAGASVGANFLQIRSIQDKISGGTATKDDFAQLRDLEKQGPKGYATGAKKLFDRYKANYLQTAQSDRETLLSRLENGKLKQTITAAWDKAVVFADDADGKKKRDFLKSLDDLLQVTAAPLDDASAVLTKDKADPAQKADENSTSQANEASPEKIVLALKKINRFDINLTNGISKLNVSETSNALVVAKGALETESNALKAKDADLQSKQQLITQATDSLQKLEAGQAKAEAISKQRAIVDEQQTAVNKASQAVVDQKAKVAEAESKVKAAEATHKAVVDNRDKAHASAKNIVDTLLLEMVGRRKKASGDYEQAIVFIGDGLKN